MGEQTETLPSLNFGVDILNESTSSISSKKKPSQGKYGQLKVVSNKGYKFLPLNKEKYRIGSQSHKNNDIGIRKLGVENEHAMILVEDSKVFIQNLCDNPEFSTTLNGLHLKHKEKVPLKNNEMIGICGSFMMFVNEERKPKTEIEEKLELVSKKLQELPQQTERDESPEKIKGEKQKPEESLQTGFTEDTEAKILLLQKLKIEIKKGENNDNNNNNDHNNDNINHSDNNNNNNSLSQVKTEKKEEVKEEDEEEEDKKGYAKKGKGKRGRQKKGEDKAAELPSTKQESEDVSLDVSLKKENEIQVNKQSKRGKNKLSDIKKESIREGSKEKVKVVRKSKKRELKSLLGARVSSDFSDQKRTSRSQKRAFPIQEDKQEDEEPKKKKKAVETASEDEEKEVQEDEVEEDEYNEPRKEEKAVEITSEEEEDDFELATKSRNKGKRQVSPNDTFPINKGPKIFAGLNFIFTGYGTKRKAFLLKLVGFFGGKREQFGPHQWEIKTPKKKDIHYESESEDDDKENDEDEKTKQPMDVTSDDYYSPFSRPTRSYSPQEKRISLPSSGLNSPTETTKVSPIKKQKSPTTTTHSNPTFDLSKKLQETKYILVSEEPVRTIKYLMALANGIPCIKSEWIETCLNEQKIVPLDDYLLVAGVDLRNQTITRQVVSSIEKTPIFHNERFLFISLKGCPDFEAWRKLIRMCGGRVVEDYGEQYGGRGVEYFFFPFKETELNRLSLDQAKKVQRPILSAAWLCECVIQRKFIDYGEDERFYFYLPSSSKENNG